jgi:hypothetical protein
MALSSRNLSNWRSLSRQWGQIMSLNGRTFFATIRIVPRDRKTIAGKFVALQAMPSFAHVRYTVAP